MKKPNRIGLSLFDEELLSLINASAKIFPITQEEADNNININSYEYGRVGNHIYRWGDSGWSYIVADDADIDWSDVKNKPVDYVPSEHNHTDLHTHNNKSIIDSITQLMVNTWNSITGKADKTYVDTELEKKSNSTHDHDVVYSKLPHTHPYAPTVHNHDERYYTETEIDTKLLSKSDGAHNHDGAYYKKTEVDSQMNGKAPTVHVHTESQITNLDKYTKAEVDNKIATRSLTNHTHSDLHNHVNKPILDKIIETTPKLSYDLSELQYIEDIRNGYTEGHSHDNFSILQSITQLLIDAWNSAVTHTSDVVKHITTSERTLWNTVSGKSDTNHAHDTAYSKLLHKHTKVDITDLSLDWLEVENKPLVFPPVAHNHDDKYYTESEVDTKLSSKADGSTLSGHTSNSTIHVTSTDKTNWNGKANLSDIPTPYVHPSTHPYSMLTGVPTIPTTTNQLTNNSGFITIASVPAQLPHTAVGTVKPTNGSMWYEVI